MDVDKVTMDEACAEYASYVSESVEGDVAVGHQRWGRVVGLLGYPALESPEVGRVLHGVWLRLRGGSDG